nr:MAG: hypothetical protein [Bacteriophage sp.]
MFLSKDTIKNVQHLVEANTCTIESVTVEAIYSEHGETYVKMTVGGLGAVAVFTVTPGQMLHNHILDAVRWKSYYLLSEVYGGLECDDAAEKIMKLWPSNDGTVHEIKSPLKAAVEKIDEKRFTQLQKKFNKHY